MSAGQLPRKARGRGRLRGRVAEGAYEKRMRNNPYDQISQKTANMVDIGLRDSQGLF